MKGLNALPPPRLLPWLTLAKLPLERSPASPGPHGQPPFLANPASHLTFQPRPHKPPLVTYHFLLLPHQPPKDAKYIGASCPAASL